MMITAAVTAENDNVCCRLRPGMFELEENNYIKRQRILRLNGKQLVIILGH
jgi:hypothetical protein